MRHKWLSFTFIIEMFTASFILHIFCAFFLASGTSEQKHSVWEKRRKEVKDRKIIQWYYNEDASSSED